MLVGLFHYGSAEGNLEHSLYEIIFNLSEKGISRNTQHGSQSLEKSKATQTTLRNPLGISETC